MTGIDLVTKMTRSGMTTPLGPHGGGAAMERRPLKSALKTRKGPSSRRGEARQQWEAEQTALMVSQAQARLARERKIYETCEALCAPGGVEIEQLEEAAQWLSKDDYKDVIKERSGNPCGYPLCVNNADGSGGDQVGESSRVKLLLYEHQEHKKGKQSKGRNSTAQTVATGRAASSAQSARVPPADRPYWRRTQPSRARRIPPCSRKCRHRSPAYSSDHQ